MGCANKIRRVYPGLCRFVIVGSLLFGAASLPAQPPVPDSSLPPLKAVFTLESAPSILQGEPIIVRYDLRNLSDSAVPGNFGSANDEWYTIRLVDDAGKSATRRTVLDSEWPFGYKVARYSSFMKPGETRSGSIVITRDFEIPHPGKWTLTATPKTSLFFLYSGRGVCVDQSKKTEADKPSPVPESKFVVTILPSRSAPLRTTAEKLRETVQTESDRERRLTALTALVSMPERDAGPVWEALAKDPLTSSADSRAWARAQSDFAKALGKVPSWKTTDILVSLHEKREGGLAPGVSLVRMSQQVEGPLKAYIESLLRKFRSTDNPIAVP
ncbi:MAG: hypothetical protein V4671_27915 [Armatimonadota bacterium]